MSIVSSGIEFVRDLVLEIQRKGMPQKDASGRRGRERRVGNLRDDEKIRATPYDPNNNSEKEI